MNELQITTQNSISIYDDESYISQIKEIYCKDLTQNEFKIFLEIGKSCGLNPFMREIWAVKYGSSAAQIFIGRDGYRKAAQEDPQYDYHHVDAIYEKDVFSYNYMTGDITHKYAQGNRGRVVGAFCVVKRKNSSKAIYVYSDFNEYSTGKSLWQSKPATMIKKVAEAQALRMAFQGKLAGTYSEEENWIKNVNYDNSPVKTIQTKDVQVKSQEIYDQNPIENSVEKVLSEEANDFAIKFMDCKTFDEIKVISAGIKEANLDDYNREYLKSYYLSAVERVS